MEPEHVGLGDVDHYHTTGVGYASDMPKSFTTTQESSVGPPAAGWGSLKLLLLKISMGGCPKFSWNLK